MSIKGIIKLFSVLILTVGLLQTSIKPISVKAANDSNQNAALAYYRVASNLTRLGINTEDIISANKGISYAELIDFDNNGILELYVIYFDSGNDNNSLPSYIQEVWTYNKGKAIKVFKEEYNGFGLVFDRGVSISTAKNKSYMVYSSSYSRDGSSFDTYTFLTLSGNKFIEIAEVQSILEYTPEGNERMLYKLKENGKWKSITEVAYRQTQEKYGYSTRKKIIDGNAGSNTFVFDPTGNVTKIQSFLQKLKDTARASIVLKDIYPSLTADEKSGLTAFLYNFNGQTDLRSFNSSKFNHADIMRFLSNAMLTDVFDETIISRDSKLEPIEEDGGMTVYIPYKADQVNALVKKLFGFTIAKKDYPVAKYRNGYFFIKAPMGGEFTLRSPQAEHLYQLKKDLYYVEFVVYAPKYPENDAMLMSHPYLRSKDTWSNDVKTLFTKNSLDEFRTGFALLKQVMVKGQKEWTLVRYGEDGILSNNELAAYRK
ncbi:hypothetical protein J41TS12_05940 [Paenibacillus antibioticophila]|uniref:Uncharacterized protein n=1 Tax=Paenibacillus antibioticophila TaxID=1274374 RepID=A0A919XSW5_9BACL|nr:hypothetical protein [Paenibacillus antibioticophila]GIO35733.1 hypothetical protein J41TS12_05940 [Paenibacillus antibioticophila]